MKRAAFLITVLALVTLACSFSATPQPAPTLPRTVEPITATVPSPATATPISKIVPTETAQQPSATTQPSPAPTQTSAPAPISKLNADHLAILRIISIPDARKVAFSPDGSLLAVAYGNAGPAFGVRILRAATGELVQAFEQYTGIVWDVAFSPDGQTIATAADDTGQQGVRVWRISDSSLVRSLPGPAYSVAFSPDGSLLAAGGLLGSFPNGVAWVYNTADWTLKRHISASGQNVTTLSFSPDGKNLIAGGTGGAIYDWNLANGVLMKSLNGGKQANSISVSSNALSNRLLVASTTCGKTGTSGCTQGGVSVWNLNDNTLLQKFTDAAECVAFSPDGRLLVSGSGQNDPNIRIRATDNWALLNTLQGPAYAAAFSPDGTLLATATTGGGTVTVWNVQ